MKKSISCGMIFLIFCLLFASASAASLYISAFEDNNADGKKSKYENYISEIKFTVVDEQNNTLYEGMTTNTETKIDNIQSDFVYVIYDGLGKYSFSKKIDKFSAHTSAVNSEGAEAGKSNIIDTRNNNIHISAGVLGGKNTSSISGKVWMDSNNNGRLDKEENGFAGVEIIASHIKTGAKYKFVSEDDGLWSFNNIPVGKYKFSARLPKGYLFAPYTREGRNLRSYFTPYVGNFEQKELIVSNDGNDEINIGVVKPASLEVFAFLDENYNGVYDDGEKAINNYSLELARDTTSKVIAKIKANKNGRILFPSVRAQTYKLRAILLDPQLYFSKTSQGQGDKHNQFKQYQTRRDSIVSPIRFENGTDYVYAIAIAKKAKLSGKIYIDSNLNGRHDKGEKLMPGIMYKALDSNGNEIAKGISDAQGKYSIESIYSGKLKLEFTAPKDYMFIQKSIRAEKSIIENVDEQKATSHEYDIIMGDNIANQDTSLIKSGKIYGRIFKDLNDNKVLDEAEFGLGNIKVEMLENDSIIYSTLSDENGNYSFNGILPGSYSIRYTIENELCFANAKIEEKQYQTENFSFSEGDQKKMEDLAIIELAKLESIIYIDENGDMNKNPNEKLLSGAKIRLVSSNGNYSQETISNTNGLFVFDNLRPTDYQLSIELPDKFVFSANKSRFKFDYKNKASISFNQNDILDLKTIELAVARPSKLKIKFIIDENSNGIVDDNENKLASGTVLLNTIGGISYNITSSDGIVEIDNLLQGKYNFNIQVQDNQEILSDKFALRGKGLYSSEQLIVHENEDLGEIKIPIKYYMNISGKVYSIIKDQKQGYSGANIILYNNGELASTTSDENGYYEFKHLNQGEYKILIKPLNNKLFALAKTLENSDNTTIIESVDKNGNGVSKNALLAMPSNIENMDIILLEPAKLSGLAFLDNNKNGILDTEDETIQNIVIDLLDKDLNIKYTSKTDGNGFYHIDNVYPDKYIISVKLDESFKISTTNLDIPIIANKLVKEDGTKAYSQSFDIKSAELISNAHLGFMLKDGVAKPSNLNAPDKQDWSRQEVHTNKAWQR